MLFDYLIFSPQRVFIFTCVTYGYYSCKYLYLFVTYDTYVHRGYSNRSRGHRGRTQLPAPSQQACELAAIAVARPCPLQFCHQKMSYLPFGNKHSYWTWPFIVDLPIKIVIFHSYVNIYQRVPTKRVFMMSCVFEKCVVSILPEMILKDI